MQSTKQYLQANFCDMELFCMENKKSNIAVISNVGHEKVTAETWSLMEIL